VYLSRKCSAVPHLACKADARISNRAGVAWRKRALSSWQPWSHLCMSMQFGPAVGWFRQEGEAACLRCPQIVTDHPTVSWVVRHVADPNT
jgi:hypothetical protein